MSHPGDNNVYWQTRHDNALYKNTDLNALTERIWDILNRKIFGLSFSPVVDGQSNLSQISEAQIRERLEVIKSYTKWIRTFSCTAGHEQTPQIAKNFGLKTMVGVWIDDDLQKNEEELTSALHLVEQGHVDILAVGNEVLLRDEISEDQLIEYIQRAKEKAGDVPVGYVDAYFKFDQCPRLVETCDVLLVNCYPFWEERPIDHALVYMKDMYNQALKAAKGKEVIIAETGWPTRGTAFGEAVPSHENGLKYFIEAYDWANREGIELIYFSAFDEAWKVAKEGDVGAYWGLWNSDGKPKFA